MPTSCPPGRDRAVHEHQERLRNLIAKERAADLDELRRLIESGAVTPTIDRTFPLVAAPDAIRHVAAGHAAGKTVVTG